MLTLSIQNLSVHFSGNHVINDVSATLHGGEMVAVVGRNGVGKTTLIKAIARLIKRCARSAPPARRHGFGPEIHAGKRGDYTFCRA